MLGTTELIVIGIVLILLFGGAAIPKLARGIGQAIGEFKRARTTIDAEIKAAEKGALAPQPPAQPPAASPPRG